MIPVLDHGGVELVDFMGGDHRVTQGARVSLGNFNKDTTDEADAKLINYLMNHRHGTPFEHSVFTFYIKAPIFVAREWMRHRIGSFNEVSGRYAQLPHEFYNPKPLRRPHPTNRQSSIPWDNLDTDEYDAMRMAFRRSGEMAYALYQRLIDAGVAREVARMVLPVNIYTEWVWTVNARSLMNFVQLRLHEDAQLEIAEYAKVVNDLFTIKMPRTAEAFRTHGLIAP